MQQSSTLMSHTLGAVLTASALIAGLRAIRTGKAAWLFLLGLALGLQAATRLLNAFALGLPCLVLSGMFVKQHWRSLSRVGRGLAALASATALMALLHLAYNHALTGSATRFPQRAYFEATEVKPHCSDPGFGPDRVCTNEHPPMPWASMPGEAFYPRHGVRLTYVRLDMYSREAAAGVFVFAFLIGGLIVPGVRRPAFFCLLVYGPLWASYATFYYHGLAYGTRYYFEATPCVWIGVALGILETLRPLLLPQPCHQAALANAPAPSTPRVALGGLLGSLIALLILLHPLARWPHMRTVWFRDLTKYRAPLEQAIQRLEKANVRSIVAHPLEWGPAVFNPRPWDLESQSVIVVHDPSFRAFEELLRHFPGRRLFRWNQTLERLEEVRPDPHRIVLEPELYFPRVSTHKGHAKPARGGGIFCLKLFGDSPGASAEMLAHFPAGTYEAYATFVAAPDAGRVRLDIDGQPLVTDVDLLGTPAYPLVPSPQIVRLEGERHRIRFALTGKSPLAPSYTACFDRLVLKGILPRSSSASAHENTL